MAEPIAILGLVGVVDICWTWGKKLVETCEAFRHADTQLDESIIRLEARWLRIEDQLQMVRKMDPLLDGDHRRVQQQALEVVLAKLKVAVSKLEGVMKKPELARAPLAKVEVKKLKYSIIKEGLAEAISELEKWQQIFDPSWFLMLRIADPQVDSLLEAATKQQAGSAQSGLSVSLPAAQYMRRAINLSTSDTGRSSIYLPLTGLVAGSIRSVPFSTASTARRADNQQRVLLDPVTCVSRTSVSAMVRDIRSFARSLRHADPFTFGLLECKGILKEEGDGDAAAGTRDLPALPTGLAFVFRLPATHPHVESLRGRLLGGADRAHDSLSERFVLARQMAVAVSFIHLYGFVHKNIRPETILLCHPPLPGSRLSEGAGGAETASETAVLVGFDVLREAEGKTSRKGDDDWEKNLYRHPQRQGRSLNFDYEMRHDIYSLGVCLLEIGLWESFVDYRAGAAPPLLGPGLIGVSDGDMSGPELLKDPEQVKGRLLRLARGPLRRKMGTLYGRVVETCLTCLEKDNVDFGDEREFQDEDGVAVGVRYIEKVVVKLGEITA
ncbi:Protein kinase domain-containing protein [Madurella fahalii]|uniref:Protein kinase domain-containing protein n=1 Tax=Madurella fahalii TaxID=1157608 RepID=A0ABQ0GCL5_9PEZI